jgi:hypothetical protein
MPKDNRLYMTFPIDFWMHPKVAPLSVLAKWTFVEMNGYSRLHRLDGRIPEALAKHQWKAKPLAELVASDPERPLVEYLPAFYVIRDYAEHQFTTDDEEELHQKRAQAGAKGGKASAIARASAKHLPEQNEAESESRSGIVTDVSRFDESSHLPDGVERDSDSRNFGIKARALRAGISDLPSLRRILAQTTGQLVSDAGAVLMAEAITSKAKGPVGRVDAYLATVCRNSAAEVQQAYFDLDIGALSDPAVHPDLRSLIEERSA